MVSLVAAGDAARAQSSTRSFPTVGTMWIDVGGASLRQPGSIDRRAGTGGLGGIVTRGAWTVVAEGAVTVSEDSLGAAQVVSRLSYAPTRLSWSETALVMSATSLGVTWPGADGSQSVLLRQYVSRGPVRAFAGAGVGQTRRPELEANGRLVHAGVEATRGAFTGQLSVQRATTDDWQLMEASGIVLKRVVPSYGLHDATLELAWQRARVRLVASHGWRAGFGETQGTSTGYGVSAAWRVASALQVIAHGGRQMADPLRGVPQATFGGVMARWQWTRSRSNRTAVDRNAEYQLTPVGNGADLVLKIDAPSDAMVEVASSTTDWAPVRVVAQGNRFVVQLHLPSGTHRVAVRVNGGAWRAPRGLVRVDDEYGGASGIVVVP